MGKFQIGDNASFSKTISESDIYNFAIISGDFNPIHTNEAEAEKSVFKRQIVHGALVVSYISTVLGMQLPGPGTIYLSQECHFLLPVYIGDTVTASVTITYIDEKNNAFLSTEVINQNGDTVIKGQVKVKLPFK